MKKRAQKGDARGDQTGSASSPDAASDRRPLNLRPNRGTQLSSDARSDAEKNSAHSQAVDGGGRSYNPEGPDSDVTHQVAQQVFALIQENHLYTGVTLPDADALAVLKRQAPEIYELYVKALETTIADESYTTRAPYEIPREFARRGQNYGLAAVLASLLVVCYAIYANEPWIAGVLGTIDLVALAAVFGQGGFSKNNDQRSDGE